MDPLYTKGSAVHETLVHPSIIGFGDRQPDEVLHSGQQVGLEAVRLMSASGMSRALLKLSGSLVHDYATIADDSPSPNRASRARRAATSASIS